MLAAVEVALADDLADLELDDHEARLETLDRERMARLQGGPVPRQTVGDRPAEPPPESWRWCRCDAPLVDAGEAERACFHCGKPLNPASRTPSPASQGLAPLRSRRASEADPFTGNGGSSVTAVPWTPADEDALRELAHHARADQWQVGDLAARVIPVGNTRANTGALALVRELADRAGMEFATLKKARSASAAWPPATRVRAASWSAHATYLTGGAANAIDRAALLQQLADQHGHVTADAVRLARGNRACRPTVDPLRSFLGRVGRLRQLARTLPDERPRDGHTSPATLRTRAGQLRALADRLEALAES